MKKILIIISVIVLGICIFIFLYNENEKNLLFTIEDTSMKCISNVLYVYDDNYVLKNGHFNMKKGRYNFNVIKLIEEIKEIENDNITYNNYKVTISGDNYYVTNDNEQLKSFFDEIGITSSDFYCN